jgi:hypothetical protein
MTRRFKDDIKTDINLYIVNNTQGEITPDILRPIIIDGLDSNADDEAGIASSTINMAVAVTDSAWTVLSTDIVVGGDAEFLIVDGANDKVTTAAIAGYSYTMTGLASISATNGAVFELAVIENGVPVGYVGSLTTRGAAKPVSVQAYNHDLSTASSREVQLAARIVSSASGTIDVYGCSLVVTIKPTNNAA